MDSIKVDRDEFQALCEEHGVGEHANYSGRGMFGEVCVGAYGDTGSLAAFLADAPQLTDGDRTPWRRPSSDSLGLDIVWYWPGIQVAD